MTEPGDPTTTRPARAGFRLSPSSGIRIGCWSLFLLALVLLLGLGVIIQLPFLLVAGWGFFIVRELPALRPDWPMLLSGLGAGGLYLTGLHLLASRIAQRQWHWRHSLRLWALTIGPAVTGIALICIVHQLSWLPRNGPLLSDYHARHYAFDIRADSLLRDLEDSDRSRETTQGLWNRYAPRMLYHGHQIRLIYGPDDRIRALVSTEANDDHSLISIVADDTSRGQEYAVAHRHLRRWIAAIESGQELAELDMLPSR